MDGRIEKGEVGVFSLGLVIPSFSSGGSCGVYMAVSLGGVVALCGFEVDTLFVCAWHGH